MIAAEVKTAAQKLASGLIKEPFKATGLYQYTSSDGTPLYWRLRADPESGGKVIRPFKFDGREYIFGEPDFQGRKPLYRLHDLALRPNDTVWVVEGERCADALSKLGLLGTTSGGATSHEHADYTPLKGRKVVLWADYDPETFPDGRPHLAGQKHADAVYNILTELGCTVEAIDIQKLGLPQDGSDCVDWLRANPEATAADIEALPRCVLTDDQPRVELLSGADITPEPVDWLWPGYLAKGKLHILAGAPGTGKTTIALAMAATLTKPGRWPDGSRCNKPGNVVIWSGEDDARDTLMPRIIACGGDPSRTFFVGDVHGPDGRQTFDPAKHLQMLEREVTRIGGIDLLIVDPVVSAVAGDSHKNAETRRGLQPIVELASRFRCAALGISHFSKGSTGRDPIERVTGSMAFGALARLVFAAAKCPDEDGSTRRTFVRAKSNLGPDGGGFDYELEQVELPEYPGVTGSRVLWGGSREGSARELLAEADVDTTAADRSELSEAREFLASLLTDASGAPLRIPSRQVKREAEGAGFAWRTIERARRDLGIEVTKQGMRDGWAWSLPPKTAKNCEDRQQKGLAVFGKVGGLRESGAADGEEVEVIV